MTHTHAVRRGTAALAALALAAAGTVAGSSSIATAQAHRQDEPSTTVTFKAADCEGCRIRAHQVLDGEAGRWQSRSVTIVDGAASLVVPSARTHGLSASIRTPWDGATGYVTQVAFRYGRTEPGQKVPLAEAMTKKTASGCWAGSDEGSAKLRLKVKRVRVAGAAGPTAGTIAYTVVTQDFYRPMEQIVAGVLGSQDVLVCAEP